MDPLDRCAVSGRTYAPMATWERDQRTTELLAAASITLLDGRSGSGKTQLAGRLAQRAEARVIHLDDLYPGWYGFAEAQDYLLERILRPLASGRTATWQRWNWHANLRDVADQASPNERLIIEGSGALTSKTRALADLSIWLEAPEPIRRARALARDGDDWWWQLWAEQEEQHLRAHRPAELADTVIAAG